MKIRVMFLLALAATSSALAQVPAPVAAPQTTTARKPVVRAEAELGPAVDTSAPQATPAPGPAPAPAATPRPASAGGTAQPTPAGAPSATGPKGPRAMDRVDLDASQITGNRELPRVLYVVPWRAPDAGDLEGRPVNSLLYELTRPVDRDVFRRENRYFDALQRQSAAAAASGTPAPVPTAPAAPGPEK
jgi:hypothetical protein